MLMVAQFVVRQRLVRRALKDPASATAAFDQLCASMVMIEPGQAELDMAAAFEEAAARAGLELDAGESQLLAVLLNRGGALLLTGDKRAISAIAQLEVEALGARLASLEQLMRIMLNKIGADALRSSICAEPDVDKALSICCACHRPACPQEEIVEGLTSYARALANSAGDILIADADFLALAA